MILDPVAAYVVKAIDVADGSKVFINICTDQQVAPPETLDASEIAMQVIKGKDWIVPIVVSTGRTNVDKAGNPCFVADCCMSPAVVMLGIEDPSVKVLTVETCIELVEERFGKRLSRDYKFPRLKAKGILEKTEVDLSNPQNAARDFMDVEGENTTLETPTTTTTATAGTTSTTESSTRPPRIEVVSSTQPEFYFHIYRGNYSGEGQRPSHVVELDGEHHDVQCTGNKITLSGNSLDLKFTPNKLDAFYNSDDSTTYIMIWN